MIRVIEQFSEGKSPSRPSEDRLYASDSFCAVIDGSTSKAPPPAADGHTTGWLAATILSQSLRTLPPQTDAIAASRHFTSAIARYYADNGLTDTVRRHPERRLTASMVVYSHHRREIWLYGDCQFRLAGRTCTHPKTVDTILSGIRADIIHYLLRHGMTKEELQSHDLGRDFIYSALRDQCGFQNAPPDNPYAYPVIDGFDIHHEDILIFRTNTGQEQRHPIQIILASDGYPVLCDTLEETETRLHTILRADPLMAGLCPTTKGVEPGNRSFDDRTYLRFSD